MKEREGEKGLGVMCQARSHLSEKEEKQAGLHLVVQAEGSGARIWARPSEKRKAGKRKKEEELKPGF